MCEGLPYRTGGITVSRSNSIIDTGFFIDREIHKETEQIYLERLGDLPDGYEWLAFTFRSQPMNYNESHFEKMLEFSTEQLNDAYSRMDLNNQPWAKGTAREVNVLETLLPLTPSASILDVGCGQGRHSLELAKRGYTVVGIDASAAHIQRARKNADGVAVDFKVWDARKRLPGKAFDFIICLYDVIGSYRTLADNTLIVHNIAQKLRKGGMAVISVMNGTHIRLRATHRGSVRRNPQLLLDLPASNNMQHSGDMFNVDYQLLDEEDHLVYHKEQFEQDGLLSAEYVVADYRFTAEELSNIFVQNGLEVVETRFVRAGHFDESLSEEDDHAKECLFVVRKR
jgi:2-polyprenyl-3-methyl-5-hydroxy-6-metoxy-1,4-benzoquinol methylase